MRDMMNMVITDNELDNVNGGVAKSVNSYSISLTRVCIPRQRKVSLCAFISRLKSREFCVRD